MPLELEAAKAKADCRLLYRDVIKLVRGVNALLNMHVVVETKVRGLGRLVMRGDDASLEVYMPPGGFGPSIKTSLAISSSKNPSSVGDSVTFTATVTPALNVSVAATGTVQFYIDHVAYGSPVNLAPNGTASAPAISSLTLGDHAIGAHYSGDDVFFPSDAPDFTQHVRILPVLTITANPNPVAVNAQVTFTATLTNVTQGAATGTVQFYIDGNVAGTAQVVSSNKATLQTSIASVGNHNIQAHYSGDSTYGAADAPTFVETVSDIPTTYNIDGTLTPTYPGTYTYHAYAQKVGSSSPSTDIPSYQGSVTVSIQIFSTAGGGGTAVFVNSVNPPISVAVVNGVATFTISSNGPSIGFHIYVQDNAYPSANDLTLGIFT